MKKLNAFQLKVVAVIVMLMDHLYLMFPKNFPVWFHPLSRFVAPLFAFLVVEGLFHTKSKFKYNCRLFGFAIFMTFGNYIINNIFASKGITVGNNIFFTLAIGLTVLNLFHYSKSKVGFKKIALSLFAIWLCGLGIVGTEGGKILIPFMLISYFFRENTKKKIVVYSMLSLMLLFINYGQYDAITESLNMLIFNLDFLFISVVPFILLYNGERGPNTKFSKYLFYVFYPLHLWILAIVKFVLK